MKELAINIFAYGDDEHVHSMGYCTYMMEGSYEELTNFLRSRVHIDHEKACRFDIEQPLTWLEFRSMSRLGVLPDLFANSDITFEDAIYCLTPIVNGMPTIDELDDTLAPNIVPDYLRIYLTDAGFDFSRLIDDDYLDAIRILWNCQKYIAVQKLLFSMIDTLAFVEYGPVRGCFTKWLNDYCDLEEVGVTAEELWELRNSLIHMTNLDSNRVRNNSIERLLPVITSAQNEVPLMSDGFKCFHLSRFIIRVLPYGIEKWVRSYNKDPKKFSEFVYRYDSIVSEARMSIASQRHTE